MRLAPVPIRYVDFYPNQIEELSRLAEESSLPTHASEQCLSACRYLATVLAGLIHGEDRHKVLSPDWQPLQDLNELKPLHPLIQEPERSVVNWPGLSGENLVATAFPFLKINNAILGQRLKHRVHRPAWPAFSAPSVPVRATENTANPSIPIGDFRYDRESARLCPVE